MNIKSINIRDLIENYEKLKVEVAKIIGYTNIDSAAFQYLVEKTINNIIAREEEE